MLRGPVMVCRECIEAVGTSTLRLMITKPHGHAAPEEGAQWAPRWQGTTGARHEEGHVIRYNTDKSVG
jgi:hypothetical protein